MTHPISIVRILTRLNIGGPAIHAAALSCRLDPQRFSTCLVIGRPDASEGDFSDLVDPARAEVIRISSLRRAIRPFADAHSWLRLAQILWKKQPRILHTHMAKAGALGRLAGLWYNAAGPGRRCRAVLVHTFHGHVLEGYFSSWSNRVFLSIERWLARRTDCLIAVSPTIRDQLLTLGIGAPKQWRVISVGLQLAPLSQLPMPNGASPVRVGMVGRLAPIKHPSLLLGALERLTQRATSMRAVLVGDGPLRESLEQEARQRGLSDVVRFTGWQRDLPSVYGNLEVACLTSWNEGTPVALIEAMAAGRAVIATRVGGVPDLLEEHPQGSGEIPEGDCRVTSRGILVRPGDVEGLTRALAMLENDPPLRRRLGEAARAYVTERFDQQRLIRDIEALYASLLEEQAES